MQPLPFAPMLTSHQYWWRRLSLVPNVLLTRLACLLTLNRAKMRLSLILHPCAQTWLSSTVMWLFSPVFSRQVGKKVSTRRSNTENNEIKVWWMNIVVLTEMVECMNTWRLSTNVFQALICITEIDRGFGLVMNRHVFKFNFR